MTDLSSYKPLIRKADDGISTFPFPAHDNAYHTTPFVQKSGDTMSGNLSASGHIITALVIQTDNDNTAYFSVKNSDGSYINLKNTGTGNLEIQPNNGDTTKALKLNNTGVVLVVQAPTASAPAYVKGGIYFDTTLNKLRVGGATAWETVTSS